MRFFADLHIHSRFSRATSKYLTIQELCLGAQTKGINVLGTGDFTHPAWISELRENLVEDQPGFYRLRQMDTGVRFVLTSEISTIYKQDGQVRKVHHLLLAPDFSTVEKISASLAAIGNIVSDGRPILGITSRNLLEIVLEAGDDAYIIPAHIWTPWFSALGSKSGFDSIAECYLDLEPHIFALETGLSSDPPMNWMVSSLDRYRLVSNSDAHSSAKIAREATIFDAPFDYYSMIDAMKTGKGLEGTVEFFPQEGKYHLDGHRKCAVVLTPQETKALGGICPVCNRPVTVGVLNRVMKLADRDEGRMPKTANPFYSLTPLPEILGEIMHVGSGSKRVKQAYDTLIREFGSELSLLLDEDLSEIASRGSELLSLGISHMREGKVHKVSGFDGEFGRVRVLRDDETGLLSSMDRIGSLGRSAKKRSRQKKIPVPVACEQVPAFSSFNAAQAEAIAFDRGNLIVKAGPGTGKTRVLVERIKRLRRDAGESCLAITFTTKAAKEIRDRLGDKGVDVYTFHALSAMIMDKCGLAFDVADEDILVQRADAMGMEDAKGFVRDLVYALSTLCELDDSQTRIMDSLEGEGVYPYEGLILKATDLLRTGEFRPAWTYVMVDEFQDINPAGYALLKGLKGEVMVIGDPNQSIYAFRGSSPKAFDTFRRGFSGVKTLALQTSYRLSHVNASAANGFIGDRCISSPRQGTPICLVDSLYPGEFIASEIEGLCGGMTSIGLSGSKGEYAPCDIAVIVRTRSQARPVMDALSRASIPFDSAYAVPLASIRGVSERLDILQKGDLSLYLKGLGEKGRERISRGLGAGNGVQESLQKAYSLVESLSGSIVDRIDAIETCGLFRLSSLDSKHLFYHYARTFGANLPGFIRFLRLSGDQEVLGQGVRVITAHAAKGLEFKCVFITGTFPLEGFDAQQEKNLFYVAMTRPLDILYLVPKGGPDSGYASFVSRDLCALHKETRQAGARQLLFFDA
ncbi:MAG: AAA family ATPase [Thermodesulfobacteriota bacterium]|nr:AAA family ATPase [Thermodesulfobacteriota bacterium]